MSELIKIISTIICGYCAQSVHKHKPLATDFNSEQTILYKLFANIINLIRYFSAWICERLFPFHFILLAELEVKTSYNWKFTLNRSRNIFSAKQYWLFVKISANDEDKRRFSRFHNQFFFRNCLLCFSFKCVQRFSSSSTNTF